MNNHLLKQASYDLGKQPVQHRRVGGMKMLNALEKAPRDRRRAGSRRSHRRGFGILLRLLSPITPHIAHALWQELGYGDEILAASWPFAKQRWCRTRSELVLQVNGKLRGGVRVAAGIAAQRHRGGWRWPRKRRSASWKANRRKVVVVPGRLVNIVA